MSGWLRSAVPSAQVDVARIDEAHAAEQSVSASPS